MILRLIEGDLVPVACMENDPNECTRFSKCATLDVWKQLNDAINGVVDNITLADLVRNQKAKLTGEKSEQALNAK
jgi:DNA-binding IscR family transcriptional regulator